MPMRLKADFLRNYGYDAGEVSAAGIVWTDLRRIHADHEKRVRALEPVGSMVAERLMQCDAVHSVGSRAKEPEHLVEKIIRKSISQGSVWATLTNYHTKVTDLVGARALYLFLDDWRVIHKFILDTWDLEAPPEANVRPHDPAENKSVFRRAGCNVVERTTGYRAVHYLAKVKLEKEECTVEIQVRTLFEEAASELDHRVRYPYFMKETSLENMAGKVHQIAALGDEVGIMAKTQKDYIALLRESPVDLDAAERQLQKLVRKHRHVQDLYHEVLTALMTADSFGLAGVLPGSS